MRNPRGSSRWGMKHYLAIAAVLSALVYIGMVVFSAVPKDPFIELLRTEESGPVGTTEYKVGLRQIIEKEGAQKENPQTRPLSFWHDIPLRPATATSSDVFYYVNEIPLGTKAKYEVQTKEAGNPIRQDEKKGKVREYTYGATFFNYGCIPQTWEDRWVQDSVVPTAYGDNDPIDVMEVGSQPLGVGEVAQIQVLGAIGMLDQGEVDWKILGINVRDPMAHKIKDLTDLDKVMPDMLRRITDWLINYKTTDGKPQNKLSPEKPLTKREAIQIVLETHQSYKDLLAGHTPPGKLHRGGDTKPEDETVPVAMLLSVANDLVTQAGKKIVAIQKSAVLNTESKGKTAEGVNDPKTDADMASHWTIVNGIAEAFPGVHVESEEHGDPTGDVEVNRTPLDTFRALDPDWSATRVKQSDITVWVDPLDATKEFTEGLTQFVTVMACVAVKGKPVAGVVHFPFLERTAWGYVGFGTGGHAARNVSKYNPDPTKPRVAVSMSHPGEIFPVVEKLGGLVVSAAGSGYKGIMVLEGTADLYVHRTLIKKWDTCSMNAIVSAAGGKVTDWQGKELDYSKDVEHTIKSGLLVDFDNHELHVAQLKEFPLGNPDKA